MDLESASQHLSHMTTLWSLVYRAHGDSSEEVSAAQRALMQRYAGAVHRYLLGALRDRDAADELFQEFSLRFLRGDFRNAHPERGRFRNFVKTAVFHLVVDYQRAQQKRPRTLDLGVAEPSAAMDTGSDSERQFQARWREELMDRTWLALHELEQKSGQPHFTLLRLRADKPLLSSKQMAKEVGARLRKNYSIHAFRQALHRAREKFADLLVQEVAASLEAPTKDEIEAELVELGLYSYCHTALQRFGGSR
jgi:RNA polymerase sigma-70 factor (ECF subfamily)